MNWNMEPLSVCPEQVDAALRNRLSNITAACQVLQRGTKEEKRWKYLAGIYRDSVCCDRILYEQQLRRRLDDEDALRAVYAQMDLVDWCRTDCGYASELLAQAGTEVKFSCGQVAIITMADQELLDEMLYALINNAVKAGGERCQVSVGLERRGENALLTVSDRGRGFSDEALERFLSDEALSVDLTPGAGAGQGLRLCRAIAETHGGLLMLESAPGEGACCAVTLPIREGRTSHLGSPLTAGRQGLERARVALADVLPLESFSGRS